VVGTVEQKGTTKQTSLRTRDTAMDILPAPKTLQEWRSQKLRPKYPRSVWTTLESFFLSHGYTLWQPPSSLYQKPPNDAPRTPDGFVYRTIYCEIKPNTQRFDMIVSQALIFA
jgi:hypothetical protein